MKKRNTEVKVLDILKQPRIANYIKQFNAAVPYLHAFGQLAQMAERGTTPKRRKRTRASKKTRQL